MISFPGTNALDAVPYSTKFALDWLVTLIVVVCVAERTFGKFERHTMDVC